MPASFGWHACDSETDTACRCTSTLGCPTRWWTCAADAGAGVRLLEQCVRHTAQCVQSLTAGVWLLIHFWPCVGNGFEWIFAHHARCCW